ncbi:MAG: hypothetical protein SFY32_10120 [Bacteroidota bacterium]|nr:hypothetical protein [Bacteroidota bacterium]
MKTTTTLLILIFIISCNKQEDNKNIEITVKQNTEEIKIAIKNRADSLNGYWLSDIYLQKIVQTKSIYQNREYSTLFYAIRLDKNNLLTDSAYLASHDTHEGGFGTFLRFDTTKFCFTNNISKNFEYSSTGKIPYYLDPLNESILELKYFDKDKVERYRKIVDVETELRKILFKGKYRFENNSNEVYFGIDGRIAGLDSNSYFEPIIDFTEGIEFDCIRTNYSKEKIEKLNFYKFQFKKDTLLLYKIINLNDENFDYKFQEVPIKLIKINSP